MVVVVFHYTMEPLQNTLGHNKVIRHSRNAFNIKHNCEGRRNIADKCLICAVGLFLNRLVEKIH